MRIQATDSPRQLATFQRPTWVHTRVASGTVRLAQSNQELLAGEGLPIASTDGIVSLVWEPAQLWIMGAGGTAELEVIIP